MLSEDQLGRVALVKLGTIRRDCPPLTGSTYSSSRPLAESDRAIQYASHLPSGENLGRRPRAANCLSAPPADGTTKMPPPSRSER